MKTEIFVHQAKIRVYSVTSGVAITCDEAETKISLFITPEQAIEEGKKLYNAGKKVIAIRAIEDSKEDLEIEQEEGTRNA